MAKTTILTNNKYTAVFTQEQGKVAMIYRINYYTIQGENLTGRNVTKDDGISAYKKLIAKGYKVVACTGRA